jgi:hypothetical protein
MNRLIEIFSELGRRLVGFGSDEPTRKVIAEAMAENEWFSAEDIMMAVDAIRQEFLDEKRLRHWAGHYTAAEQRRVAIIMAGNIPLVGFFDLLCAVVAGHRVAIKPSSKDRVLMNFVVEELRAIEADIAIEEYDPEKEYDMVIATGGDEAARHFSRRYAHCPTLIRGSRHSVAVLAGDESEEEIEALQRDIFSYNGLGCRSISLIMLPRGAELMIRPPKMNRMYHGNYLHTRAMMTLTGQTFKDFGQCIAMEQREFPQQISCVNYCYYDSRQEVEQWLLAMDEKIQCVVTRAIDHKRAVGFGRAQYPTLWDYADGVDVMKFLTT